MNKIAIFASGEGTNAEWIFRYFRHKEDVKVCGLLTNNPHAPALAKAFKNGIPSVIFNREDFYNSDVVLDILLKNKVDLVVLAGFMWLVPERIVDQYPNQIINIHPALLPKYGGKGMYGDKVFQEVLKNNEKVSGITIHYVNNKYDDGDVIFQARCRIDKNETVKSLADKTHRLEHHYYPVTIERILKDHNQIKALL
ncbi:MAG: phosphoribosylglycinamide formyltransferase [Bacteroidota bacterium]